MNLSKKLSKEEFNVRYNFASSTPMMKQYLDIKFEHQDSFVLFRMGDFYELFFDDAKKGASILGITLAKRGKIQEEDIPMCGVPHHALENYLYKLVAAGAKVAISEQMETPETAKQRDGYKAVVKREVTRIITAGTVTESTVLDPVKPNYLVAIREENNKASLCYADVTTGFIRVLDLRCDEIQSALAKIAPKEIIISEQDYLKENFNKALKEYDLKLVFQVEQIFERNKCINHIENYYKIISYHSLGDLTLSQISSIGSILHYIMITHKSKLPKLEYPSFESTKDYMNIDPATLRSLELTESMYGKKQGSLLFAIDNTLSNIGARLLYNMMLAPLISKDLICHRQQYTEFFVENIDLCTSIRKILANISDLERAFNRVLMKKCLPYDLLIIKDCLSRAYSIKEEIYSVYGVQNLPSIVKEFHEGLSFDYSILDLIIDSIIESPSNNLAEGGYIKPEFHSKLFELSELVQNSKNFVQNLKIKYQKTTGIDNLRINHNNILGMYIEAGSKHADKLNDPIFIYKQSTSNSNRYTTKELQELESKIVNANFLAVALEQEIFEDVCSQIEKKSKEIKKIIKILSVIDVFSSFAIMAKEKHYSKPEITENKELIIVKGRHPIVESYLKLKHKSFVKNGTNLNENERIILLTGPNMGGKSTYLRQNAIIAILAQIGSYVPADYCKIGIVDKIFSRVGSGDDLSGGKSTFMVEMIETSGILAQATEQSLIILDEVGRGTATYDGMSIAWSILEYIHDKLRCRALFATHYNELTELNQSLVALRNFSVGIDDAGDKIFFTHKVEVGAADKSYGIHVAELAGLPKSVIKKSKILLNLFEKTNNNKNAIENRDKIHKNDIFTLRDNKLEEYKEKYEFLINEINKYNLEETTPKEAHNILSKLQLYEKIV